MAAPQHSILDPDALAMPAPRRLADRWVDTIPWQSPGNASVPTGILIDWHDDIPPSLLQRLARAWRAACAAFNGTDPA